MKAYLSSARIAPKKASIVAAMVRGLTVEEALTQLERTNKKAARFIEKLIASAAANAVHNEKQVRSQLTIKTIVVNQALGYRRGVPMARGRMRPMRKFTSHIAVTLGLLTDEPTSKKAKKEAKSVSQKSAPPVEGGSKQSATKAKSAKKAKSTSSSLSSTSSPSSTSSQ